MNARIQATVGGAGIALTVLIAWLLDLPGEDTSILLGLAAGGALAAAVVGGVVLRSARSASIRAQAVAVVVIALFGVGVGVVLAANAMFVSSHDLGALLVVLAASATVAIVMALRLGSRIGTASKDLEELARRLGDGDLLMVGEVPIAHELRALAGELASASARLDASRQSERALETARRQLVAWVSHDLRTPLAGVRAMVEALEDGVVSEPADVARYHATMRAETERLSALVDDLFELSRIEAGALDLQFESVRLSELVDEAVTAASPVAARKGVALVGECRDDDPVVDVAPAELVRVVRNLVDNAIRHTPDGGAVTVAYGTGPSGRAELSVLDACGGIPPEDIDRVFDLAFRGDDARARTTHPGGGLGLAIARGIVDAHRGHIEVQNEGAGCRFTVQFG